MANKYINKSDVKTFFVTVAGVFVAGLVMYFGRSVDLVNKARSGFDK